MPLAQLAVASGRMTSAHDSVLRTSDTVALALSGGKLPIIVCAVHAVVWPARLVQIAACTRCPPDTGGAAPRVRGEIVTVTLAL